MIAVALLDGEVYLAQLEPERIRQKDVQELLQKVSAHTGFPLHKPLTVAGTLDPYTRAYPEEMRTKVEITLKDGRSLTCEKKDYHGFFTRPLTWEDTIVKFHRLTGDIIDASHREKLIAMIRELDTAASAGDLTHFLAGCLR